MSRLRASSIPPGLRVRCARARTRPGMEQEAERWMQMLNDRRDEAVQTRERERVAIEVVFRERHDDDRPEAEPQLLLLAEPVRDAVLRWSIPA